MVEIADIFRKYGDAYSQKQKLPVHILKVIRAIEDCRTSALGGHIEVCQTCGRTQVFYNSCRNRHCPKCQNLAKERWLMDRKEDLLPVEYFHVVLTIPDKLNALTRWNQKILYEILFKAAAESMIELGKDSQYLGAEIGFIAVLHTWGQNLMDHPHLHCIVPGGGLSLNGSCWVSSPKGFFVPVVALSRLFRGKFLFYLKKAYLNSTLKFGEEISDLKVGRVFLKLLDQLYKEEWVVYCKPPFRNSEQILEYLGRYTHRVAISNQRIIKVENEQVTFRWRDYRDGQKNKLMTLSVFEFMRRFLLHILPTGFVKIRYFGILSNRNRATKLQKCQEYLNSIKCKSKSIKLGWQELLLKLTGIDPRICCICGTKMITIQTLNPVRRLKETLATNGKLLIESP